MANKKVDSSTWYMRKRYRDKRKGQKAMVQFEFKRFMTDHNLTVESFAKMIGYTLDGTLKMLKRGTIKNSLIDKLTGSARIKRLRYMR